jgi:prepilin-type N-terminal cleavage/methylation domain-containing protein
LRTIQSNSDGFTLVELLVAITIFSLIIGMAMFSLRYSFIIVRQLDAPFAEETQSLSRMRDCICSMFNYVTPSRDMFNNSKGFSTFFSGEPESMTFISKTPPSGRNMAICRLSLVKGAVVLEEAPLYDGNSDYLSPSLEIGEKKSTVVVAGATSLRLEYLRKGKTESSLKSVIPSQVRIIIAADGKESEYYCRVPTNFDEKVSLTRVSNDPF